MKTGRFVGAALVLCAAVLPVHASPMATAAPTPATASSPATASNPSAADALYDQADRMFAAGQMDQAVALYHKALDADPAHWKSLCRLGQIQAAARSYPEAEQSLKAAVAINPDNGVCQSRLAQVLLIGNKLSEAEAALEKAAQLMPGDEGVLFNLARLYENTDRPGPAADTYSRFLETAPASERATATRLKVARLYSEILQPARAVEPYRRFLEAQPGQLSVRAELATALMGASRYAEALEEYDKVISAGSADATTLSNAGAICMLLQNTPRAIELLGKAVAADPKPVPPRLSLAMVLSQSGQDARAVELLRGVTADDPENNRAWFLMGQSLMKLGRVDEARSAFERHRSIHDRIMKERVSGRTEGHP
ncbi:MAG TPA: tetratricopeptide repeat protein [Patescibacteria group bacterium]|nr:tetratricopeptide repeat protein [Patescibacteria group bacterium]